jgi:hypothetical protein
MDAWAHILSGVKTHGLVLGAVGFVIAMVQAGEISMLQAGYLTCIAGSVSTVRFALSKMGGSR